MKILNFIEAHNQSKCPGSYRKGVVFNKSGAIFRIFINFTTSKLDKQIKSSFSRREKLDFISWVLKTKFLRLNIPKISIKFSTQGAEKRIKIDILWKIRLITWKIWKWRGIKMCSQSMSKRRMAIFILDALRLDLT